MIGTSRLTAATAGVLIAVAVAGCGSTSKRAAAKPPPTFVGGAATPSTSTGSTVPPSTAPPSTAPASTAPAATSTATATIYYQAQYVKDVAAPDAYTASIRSATQVMLDKLADLVTTNASELQQQSWPPNASTDVHNLAMALDALASDLRARTVTAQSLVSADAATVRADLDLKPAPASNQW